MWLEGSQNSCWNRAIERSYTLNSQYCRIDERQGSKLLIDDFHPRTGEVRMHGRVQKPSCRTSKVPYHN